MYTTHTTITNTVRPILQFHTRRSARDYPPPMFCNRPSTTCPLSKYRNAQLVKHELSVRLNDDPGAYVMHFSKHVSVSLATTSLKTALRFSSCASKDERRGWVSAVRYTRGGSGSCVVVIIDVVSARAVSAYLEELLHLRVIRHGCRAGTGRRGVRRASTRRRGLCSVRFTFNT